MQAALTMDRCKTRCFADAQLLAPRQQVLFPRLRRFMTTLSPWRLPSRRADMPGLETARSATRRIIFSRSTYPSFSHTVVCIPGISLSQPDRDRGWCRFWGGSRPAGIQRTGNSARHGLNAHDEDGLGAGRANIYHGFWILRGWIPQCKGGIRAH